MSPTVRNVCWSSSGNLTSKMKQVNTVTVLIDHLWVITDSILVKQFFIISIYIYRYISIRIPVWVLTHALKTIS